MFEKVLHQVNASHHRGGVLRSQAHAQDCEALPTTFGILEDEVDVELILVDVNQSLIRLSESRLADTPIPGRSVVSGKLN